MLAICRGMQLLNVAYGGSLVQHLPDVVGHEEHNPTPGAFSGHRVRIEMGSSLHKALGWEERMFRRTIIKASIVSVMAFRSRVG